MTLREVSKDLRLVPLDLASELAEIGYSIEAEHREFAASCSHTQADLGVGMSVLPLRE